MAEARDRRSGSAPRWASRWLWVAALAPLFAALGASLRPTAAPAAYHELGIVWLPPRVSALQTGVDRAGTHVAMLAGDGRVHLLYQRGQRLETRSLAVPWVPERRFRLRLAFTDFNQDGLLDLVVMQPPPRADGLSPWDSNEWRCALFAQRQGHFKLERVVTGPPYESAVEGDRMLFAGSESFQPQTLFDGASSRVVTRLVNADTGRVAHVLEGEPFRIGDLDGDGNQDLLTVTAQDDRRPWASYTAWFYRAGEFRPLWRGAYQQNDLSRNWMRNMQLTDLNSDGAAELIAVEPHLGKTTVLAIRPDGS